MAFESSEGLNHNQSSRLDLDWDPDAEGGDFGEESANCLTQIEESGDDESRSRSRSSSSGFSASSMESTVVVETVSDDSSEGLNNRGGGSGRGQRRQQPQQQQQPPPPPYSHHETNGYNRRNEMKEMEREGTYSTLDTSQSSRNGEGTCKRMVKFQLWDPGEASVEPSVVTVAMDMLSTTQLENTADVTLGVGQSIRVSRQSMRGYGRSNSEGEKTVDITWETTSTNPLMTRNRKQKSSSWEPPLRISREEEHEARARGSRLHVDSQRSQPQSMESSSRMPSLTSIPKTETTSSIPKTETSEVPSNSNSRSDGIPKSIERKEMGETSSEKGLFTPVKGLEPFTIPSILTSTLIKSTPNEKVGLAFRKASGTVVIEKIVPGSAFDGTALRPGYECLCINGHRLRSARRAAEIVRESGSRLSLVASNAPRPPGTMYTIISLDGYNKSPGRDHAVGMHFKMKHGLVQLVKIDPDSPIGSTSMKVGDFILAISGSVVGSIAKAVEVLSAEPNSDHDDELLIPMLYFNMRQLRVSLVDKVIGDLWKKEWSDNYDECIVLQPGSESSNPLTLRFKEEGMCELTDPLRAFRDKSENNLNKNAVVPPDHPLNSVVETLNHGIICVLSAIREGVELATSPGKGGGGSKSSIGSGTKGNGHARTSNGEKKSDSSDIMVELTKLQEMYREGLLSKDDFDTIKSKLLKSHHM